MIWTLFKLFEQLYAYIFMQDFKDTITFIQTDTEYFWNKTVLKTVFHLFYPS